MENIVIIHFQPLEKYPPITNLLDYLATVKYNKKVIVFSTNSLNNKTVNQYSNASVEIIRLQSISAKSGIRKLLQYFILYANIFLKIIRLKPSSILYYETLSALPVYWYKKIVKKCRILIHYHEYTSKEEYAQSSLVVKYINSRERKIYPNAFWVSHTNKKRLEMFLEDEQIVFDETKHHTMPNYPSKNWSNKITLNTNSNSNSQIKFIYIGALGLKTMYIKEFAQFIINQNGKAIWHIYTNQFDGDAVKYLNSLNSNFIKLCGEINYYEIPNLIAKENYNIGLILYNGHIKNYIYNAPNKLFEYLACKLSIWYPSVMEGCKEYANSTSLPLVLEVDFTKDLSLAFANYTSYIDTVKKNKDEYFYCEDVYKNISSVL